MPPRTGATPILKPCNHNLRKTLSLVEQMIALANQGDADREDVGCGILYGIIRDSAYKIKKIAEEEIRRHQEKGWWATRNLTSVEDMVPDNPKRHIRGGKIG